MKSEKDGTEKDVTTIDNASDTVATGTEDESWKEKTSNADTVTGETSDTASALTETSETAQSTDDKS